MKNHPNFKALSVLQNREAYSRPTVWPNKKMKICMHSIFSFHMNASKRKVKFSRGRASHQNLPTSTIL